jgi:hypothetical protein
MQAKSYEPLMKKRWYTKDDNQVCPICKKFDGLEFDIEKPFY